MLPNESQPPGIAILQTGGLGDLVLSAELITGIKRAQPQAHITLISKAAIAGIAELYPVPPDDIVALEFNPYTWDAPTPELFAALRPVVNDLAVRPAEVFIEATFQPSWFAWVAASAIHPSRACCCTAISKPEFFVSSVLEGLPLSPVSLENLSLPAETRELDRYRLFMKWLPVEPQHVFPWILSQDIAEQGQRVLASFGFRQGGYLVCFPCGSVGAEAKRWPIQNFRQVLEHVQRKWGLPVLLVGERQEREALESLACNVDTSTDNIRVISGGPNDLPVMASLLGTARAYLGNDTGPVHIASAYWVPGVAIYGGGHWPAYAPWGQGSVGLLHPLPCFGCNWDCLFGHGICVDKIEPQMVEEALDNVLRAPGGAARVKTVHTLSSEAENIIALASPRYQAAQQDRAARWLCMIQQNSALKNAEKLTSDVLEEARKREVALHQAAAEIGQRDARIAELEPAAAERLRALEQAQVALDSSYQQNETLTKNVSALEAQTDSLRHDSRILRTQLEAAESERLKLAATVFALEREKLLHFLVRRLRKRRISALLP